MKPTLRQRFRYRFDNLMSRGTPAMIGTLFVLSALIVLLAGVLIASFGITQEDGLHLSFWEALWGSLMRTLDAGTMGGDTGAGFRFVMLLVTLGGIFIVSALIGVLSSAIEGKMDRLRKGRSQVLESNHTLVLGWSVQIFTILNELMIANENQSRARIVILADEDKVEMEDRIQERVKFRGGTRIVCRSGNPLDPNDLEIVSPHTAKSIIILPPENGDPDTDVIKTVMAFTNNPQRRGQPCHIVTQIRKAENLGILRLIGECDNLQIVFTKDIIARIVAQTSRQSGLSVVYTELMDFEGDEIYFKYENGLTGKTYGEALLMYEDSCVIGMRKAGGQILVNPPMDSRFERGDQVIAISEDDDTIHLSAYATSLDTRASLIPVSAYTQSSDTKDSQIPVDEQAIRSHRTPQASPPEKSLILGWNRSGAIIARELDHYVTAGSLLTIVADDDDIEKQLEAQDFQLKNQKLDVRTGDTTDRALLDSLHIYDYDHVIVLAYSTLEPQHVDARTLVTLLHLRDLAGQDETPFSIVTQMLDLRNRELAEITQVDDFIVSDHLISLMLAQLSENPELYHVFQDLFDAEGSEIYFKPVSDYVVTERPVNFYTVVEAARRRGETAIGYRLAHESKEVDKVYGIHTNPLKSRKVTFSPSDKVIVIAED
ncbi:MAG TPA: NAD-binding protein [Bacillota bacterium]|jgi:voltage-gated potassium channel Kch|nr:potassium transporter TrkA [Fastidiosipila sp.]HPX92589.1 NAD-binding protein [Bacillota bacterium]HQB81143.1 NAD-binding protein [Bacillota bacterium]